MSKGSSSTFYHRHTMSGLTDIGLLASPVPWSEGFRELGKHYHWYTSMPRIFLVLLIQFWENSLHSIHRKFRHNFVYNITKADGTIMFRFRRVFDFWDQCDKHGFHWEGMLTVLRKFWVAWKISTLIISQYSLERCQKGHLTLELYHSTCLWSQFQVFQ